MCRVQPIADESPIAAKERDRLALLEEASRILPAGQLRDLRHSHTLGPLHERDDLGLLVAALRRGLCHRSFLTAGFVFFAGFAFFAGGFVPSAVFSGFVSASGCATAAGVSIVMSDMLVCFSFAAK